MVAELAARPITAATREDPRGGCRVVELPPTPTERVAGGVAVGIAQDVLALFPDPCLAAGTLALAGAILARLAGVEVEHFCATVRECDRELAADGVDPIEEVELEEVPADD